MEQESFFCIRIVSSNFRRGCWNAERSKKNGENEKAKSKHRRPSTKTRESEESPHTTPDAARELNAAE
jgi:hypothetical protein